MKELEVLSQRGNIRIERDSADRMSIIPRLSADITGKHLAQRPSFFTVDRIVKAI